MTAEKVEADEKTEKKAASIKVSSLWFSVVFCAYGVRLLVIVAQRLLYDLLRTHAFDTSHLLTAAKGQIPITNKWDAIHFLSIALNGYEYEQQVAFMPGWPAVLRIAGDLRSWVGGGHGATYDDVMGGGGLVNYTSSALATSVLFLLTFRLTRSTSFAWTTGLFYILAPHPSAISAQYTEPLYALLTFVGYYLSVERRWILASISLALATSVRATGIFNIGILGWHILFGLGLPNASHLNPKRLLPRLALTAPLCAIIVSPLVGFQYYIYKSFCYIPRTAREWCSDRIPFPYAYVQAKYWNIGFLNYWTGLQSPNLLIAAPVIIVSITGTYAYFKTAFSKHAPQPSLEPSLLPFQILHVFLTFVLVFHSHSQIALRVCITDPVVWWNVASMAFTWTGLDRQEKMTKMGKAWVFWTIIWGFISMVLWLGHYPPA